MIGFYDCATRAVEASGGSVTLGSVRDLYGRFDPKLSSRSLRILLDGENTL
jgi:hypothetical protein